MDGDKLRKWLKNSDYTAETIVEKSGFSKSKFYNLLKQNRLTDKEKRQLIQKLELPEDFFDREYPQPNDHFPGGAPPGSAADLFKDIIKQKDEIIQQQKKLIDELLKTKK